MKPLKFSYYKFQGNLRPIGRFIIEHETVQTPFLCLIDSGADVTVSYKIIGENMGIKFDRSQLEPIFGIGFNEMCQNCNENMGKKLICPKCKKGVDLSLFAYRKKVNLIIPEYGDKISLDVLWVVKDFNPNEDLAFMLGRKDFFEKFDITVRENKKMFTLSPHK